MKNMTRGFEEALQTCLDLIRDGQETIDSVVARYPEFSEELRPQLEAALWISVYKEALTPRPGFVKASRHRLVDRIKQEKQQVPLTWRERLQQLMPMQRVAPVTFVFVLMLSLFVSGTIVSTSQKALPGDRMYGFKRTLEQLALATSLGEANDAKLQIQFVEERLAEVKALVAENRFEDVAQTAAEFEEQVNKALLLIKAVADQDPVYAKRLALELEEILANQRSIFTVFVKNVPPSVNLTLDQVLAIAEDYQEKVEVFAVFTPPTPIPTSPPPIPSPTQAPSSTPRPKLPTPTLAPTQKPFHTDEPTPAPSSTPVPTATPVPPTKMPTPTNTSKPPPPDTPTPAPTYTPEPTDTPVPIPTDTLEPTPTDTPVTPTDTPVTPTDTPVTPTDTPVTPTDTPVTPTDTPVIPTDTPMTPTDTPAPTPVMDASPTAIPLPPI